ncbi:MAG TPA: hypothetical protein VLT16_14350, partial [Candidatus Limnocylindrales bacterium]|nr:hypothetical protein [Candidatus Limnocylindrales bacterium]
MRTLIFTTLLIGVAGAIFLPSLPVAGIAATEMMPSPARQDAGASSKVVRPLKPNSLRFAVIGDSGTGSEGQYDLAR